VKPGNTADLAQQIHMFYGNPMAVLSDCLRGFLVAAPGHDLIAADFSAIEARVIAWLAGEQWKLDAFSAIDRGEGYKGAEDIYCATASAVLQRDVTKKDKEGRQIGKTCELAFGFQGGVGAWRKFDRSDTYTDEEVDEFKNAWRARHPRVKQHWYDLENAALDAVRNPMAKIAAGPKGRQVLYRLNGSFLWCRLPSGRALCYPYPRVEEIATPWGEPKMGLTYMYVDSLTKQWVRGPTYGGSLCENNTQAVARDLLAHAIKTLEASGYPVVMHAHDEAVSEVATGVGSVTEMERIMCVTPAWAAGLPVAAEGWRNSRYRK